MTKPTAQRTKIITFEVIRGPATLANADVVWSGLRYPTALKRFNADVARSRRRIAREDAFDVALRDDRRILGVYSAAQDTIRWAGLDLT